MPLLHDVAHLGHAELLTPEPEKSLWFFTQVLGLTENGASGDSVYLRTWDDYEHHSLKLTGSATSGIRRTGLRAASEEALQRRVAAIEAAGLGLGWRDGDLGIGRTYLFRDPDGHEFELYFETEWYRPTGEQKPALKNQAQAYPGRGVCVRRLDHVNFLYLYEPGGNRIELCNPCARLIFAPDWAPISWTQQERARGQAWGLATIGSFHTHGTPPAR